MGTDNPSDVPDWLLDARKRFKATGKTAAERHCVTVVVDPANTKAKSREAKKAERREANYVQRKRVR